MIGKAHSGAGRQSRIAGQQLQRQAHLAASPHLTCSTADEDCARMPVTALAMAEAGKTRISSSGSRVASQARCNNKSEGMLPGSSHEWAPAAAAVAASRLAAGAGEETETPWEKDNSTLRPSPDSTAESSSGPGGASVPVAGGGRQKPAQGCCVMRPPVQALHVQGRPATTWHVRPAPAAAQSADELQRPRLAPANVGPSSEQRSWQVPRHTETLLPVEGSQ